MTKETKKEETNIPLNVYQKFHKLMKDISYVQKGEKTVNNQYRFVSHDAVVKAVRSHILDNGLTVSSRIVEKTLEMQEITETVMVYDKQAGAKVPFFVDGKAQVKTSMGYMCTVFMEFDFINIDNPDEKITAQGFGMGIDPQDKATGKAMSYAKKYALLNALLLETGDDPEQDVDYEVVKKAVYWKTAKERTDLFNAAMKELNAAKSLDKLHEAWVGRTEHLNAFKNSDIQIYYDLEKRKDEIKKTFTEQNNNLPDFLK